MGFRLVWYLFVLIILLKCSNNTFYFLSNKNNGGGLLHNLLGIKVKTPYSQPLKKQQFIEYINGCETLVAPINTYPLQQYSAIAQIPDINFKYQEYLQQYHHPNYHQNQQTRKYRQFVYYSNLKIINEFNKAQNYSYNYYLNQFTDLKQDQFREKYATLSPRQAQYDEVRARLLQNSTELANQEIDWSCFAGSVDSQGVCGACYAFVSSDLVASMFAIHFTKFHIKLSTQQIVSCSPPILKNGCQGGLFQNTFDYIKKAGLTTAMNYPYSSAFNNKSPGCEEGKKNSKGKKKIISYNKIARNCISVIDSLQKGPLAVGISSKSMQFYSRGVWKSSPFTITDHSVLLVGYNPDIGFKIKNIWGKTWGIQGYAWIDEEQHGGLCSRAISIDIPGKKNKINSCFSSKKQPSKLQSPNNSSQIIENSPSNDQVEKEANNNNVLKNKDQEKKTEFTTTNEKVQLQKQDDNKNSQKIVTNQKRFNNFYDAGWWKKLRSFF